MVIYSMTIGSIKLIRRQHVYQPNQAFFSDPAMVEYFSSLFL